MIEQISPDVVFHRANKAVEFLTTFLIEAPVQFFPPEKKPLDIEEILKREYILTIREEIKQVVADEAKSKKEKKKPLKSGHMKLSKTQLGCGSALLIAVLGIIGISKLPGKPKPIVNPTPSSYPLDTTPQTPSPRATASPASSPETDLEIHRIVFENVGFNEIDAQTQLSYKGFFTFELNVLKSGAVQMDVRKQGGDPRNTGALIFGWAVLHQGKILMSSATTLQGPDSPRPAEPRYIHPELKKAYDVFLQFLTTENPELPENIRIAIFGD